MVGCFACSQSQDTEVPVPAPVSAKDVTQYTSIPSFSYLSRQAMAFPNSLSQVFRSPRPPCDAVAVVTEDTVRMMAAAASDCPIFCFIPLVLPVFFLAPLVGPPFFLVYHVLVCYVVLIKRGVFFIATSSFVCLLEVGEVGV